MCYLGIMLTIQVTLLPRSSGAARTKPMFGLTGYYILWSDKQRATG